jgi:16S rRNA (guanine966-N2)-methyltransferase
MRVIAGQWKGRRLKSPSGDEVRPTTDRVKEALFNILGPEVRDCLFLDLCCGAGGLGIEALSRGADEVVFIDQSRRSLALVRENLETCGADRDVTRLVCSDAVDWLTGWKPAVESVPWVLVADPPYRSGAAGAIMKVLERLAEAPGFLAGIIEHGSRTPDLPVQTEARLSWETRRYGESYLAVARGVQAGP